MAAGWPAYLKEFCSCGVCSAGWEKNFDTADALDSFGTMSVLAC